MLKAYLDESGTHQDPRVFTVAGLISESAHWELFKEEWALALRNARVCGSFHASVFLSGHGQFETWSGKRKSRLAAQLDRIIQDHIVGGESVSLPWAEYCQCFGDIVRTPSSRLRVAFLMCAQPCLVKLAERASQRTGQYVATVFDRNDLVEYPIAVLMKSMEMLGVETVFHPRTFTTKDLEVPLQAADVFACTSYQRAADRFLRHPRQLWAPFAHLFEHQNIGESLITQAEIEGYRETALHFGEALTADASVRAEVERFDKAVRKRTQKEWLRRA